MSQKNNKIKIITRDDLYYYVMSEIKKESIKILKENRYLLNLGDNFKYTSNCNYLKGMNYVEFKLRKVMMRLKDDYI